ncbi:hypothetical protein ALI144C_07075 [Actinosynnema sp. ALI-1.44]|uniref:hypothetical protein n=1 Tax=Actinosynnema sp. ALI-1.44 TaxID=1933779 RepID=UPI00097C187A|nr:hypothetical protein [Actinosynnema sp. ALI-1.44]ONI88206.1 hypothetical protein ALI144C_07075 [Actinosynnema sp. ALI-1.44]
MITQALIAAATSVVSLGSSIAVFISSVLIDLGMLLAKIGKKLAKLLKGLSKFARRFADKSDNLKRAAYAGGPPGARVLQLAPPSPTLALD